MKLKQQLPYAILTAAIGFAITFLTQWMGAWPLTNLIGSRIATGSNPVTWLCFVTWACYFAAGCNVKAALNWLYSIIVGIVAAILMFVLTFAFCNSDYSNYLFAISLAVFIVIIPMMFYDKVKINGAAMFIGTAMYFGLNGCGFVGGNEVGNYLAVAGTEIIYTILGLLCGWLTIFFFGLCMKIGAKKD